MFANTKRVDFGLEDLFVKVRIRNTKLEIVVRLKLPACTVR